MIINIGESHPCHSIYFKDLIRRWDTYAKEKMVKRNVEIGTTKKEQKRSKIVTLCHGDPW